VILLAQDRGVADDTEQILQTIDTMQEARFWGLVGLAFVAICIGVPRCVAAWKGTHHGPTWIDVGVCGAIVVAVALTLGSIRRRK
jgi:hypothetical protein